MSLVNGKAIPDCFLNVLYLFLSLGFYCYITFYGMKAIWLISSHYDESEHQ